LPPDRFRSPCVTFGGFFPGGTTPLSTGRCGCSLGLAGFDKLSQRWALSQRRALNQCGALSLSKRNPYNTIQLKRHYLSCFLPRMFPTV
ncbi:MAG TPA: hypothetical protein VHR86_08440, partial [Armatimonadota bacterium]|nr:hypothetical protein [Armatimonadota bacterium]